MVEYSAFNRFVPGSSPGQPIIANVKIKALKGKYPLVLQKQGASQNFKISPGRI